jgi:tRNA-specific 2-thiouridylase
VDTAGNILGAHPGIQFFTIGQRRKLGLNGNSENPVYVTNIDPSTNTVVVGNEPQLYKNQLWASKVTFISDKNIDADLKVKAKIRYNSRESDASVRVLADSWAEINFNEPQKAITPGQPVVFYNDNELIGGGIVETKSPSKIAV